ncbi:MAG TPA: acyltransferase [Terracidiphilus sp.]
MGRPSYVKRVNTILPASPASAAPSKQVVETRKPDRLNALTGLRSFAAVNIVFFHFSNPQWFGIFAPVVNAGYASVSYFILLSGFVLGYNYGQRARADQLDTWRFYKARFTRLYPIYLLSLLMAWRMVPQEYASHSHAMFWAGMVLSPLLTQGWIPEIATFLNTPAWTMSAESSYYVLFPFLARWRRPATMGPVLRRLAVIWFCGLIPGTLYVIFNPDGIPHPDRFSTGQWLQVLKFTPLPHLASFIFGVVLAELDELIPREGHLRFWLGVGGFGITFFLLWLGGRIPYALIHDGLLMPLFGCIILGLSGRNPLAAALGLRPLVFVGEASYCLYLLHFNFWNLIHDTHVLDHLGLAWMDPWISYVILILMSLVALHFVEKPAQRWLRKLMTANA